MTKHYDLVVIGTGTGASVVASRCRTAGWSVAVIDYLPFGGTCALRGCDPKKVLVGAAEAIDHSRRMRGKGIAGGEPAIAWKELIRFKRTFTELVPAMKENDFAKTGIDAYHGRAKFHGRLKLNEFLQSVSNPAVYAVGDAAMSGPPLTPVSSHDAKVAAANMLKGNHQKPNCLGVPSVAFTIPPIASVGLSERQARGKGLKFRMRSEKAPDWYTARRVAETAYGFKVLIEEETDHILGAHLIGPSVDEVINVFALAIRQGLTAEDLRTTIFAYPTGASDIGYML